MLTTTEQICLQICSNLWVLRVYRLTAYSTRELYFEFINNDMQNKKNLPSIDKSWPGILEFRRVCV